MAPSMQEELERRLEEAGLLDVQFDDSWEDNFAEDEELEAPSARDTKSEDSRLEEKQTIGALQPTNTTRKIGTSEAAARVFAIPELLELILLELGIHNKSPFSISNASNAMQLCRLEGVNRLFRDTLRDTPKLKLPKQDLQLSTNLREHAAVIWLLRELGHSGFSISGCCEVDFKTFDCYKDSRKWTHKCAGRRIQVEYSPSYNTSVDCKRQFEEAMKEDNTWKKLKISNPLMIYFKDSSVTYCWVESYVDTMGELWKKHGSRL